MIRDTEKPAEVAFFGGEPVKAPSTAATISAAIQAARTPAAGEPVKVRVVAPYRVVHEGKPYVGGDMLTVPASTANHWLTHKWAELVPARSKPASQKGKS